MFCPKFQAFQLLNNFLDEFLPAQGLSLIHVPGLPKGQVTAAAGDAIHKHAKIIGEELSKPEYRSSLTESPIADAIQAELLQFGDVRSIDVTSTIRFEILIPSERFWDFENWEKVVAKEMELTKQFPDFPFNVDLVEAGVPVEAEPTNTH